MNTLIIKRVIYSITLLFPLLITPSMGAEVHLQDLVLGTKYYFDDFDPDRKPWESGELRNIEEVFKNYQYIEIMLNVDGQSISVKQYVQGSEKYETNYRILPEGALQKEP